MIMSSWWFWLVSICFPPPAGYQRISYLCGCGDLSCLDVKELSPGRVDRFRRTIIKCASVARSRTQDPIVPCDQANTPAQAHLSNVVAPSAPKNDIKASKHPSYAHTVSRPEYQSTWRSSVPPCLHQRKTFHHS
ncbi:hypothetical protein FocnCong_v015264 [Fusarium oxysporum f. sp. conglutinans]|nr:hypothetical protein FocnCong_v015264 [Fusarium oxysporum f. sp. conglutinans]